MMRGKLLFVLGAGVGYVVGARAGRERYEAMKAQADSLWKDPRVQEKVSEAGEAVKHRVPDVQGKLTGAAGAVKEKITSSNDAQPPSVDGDEMVGDIETGLAESPHVPDQRL